MTYKVVIEKNEDGFSARCPQLRGCWSQGKTKKEALNNIEDAIRTYLQSLNEVLQAKEVHELEIASI